jgi:P-type Cu+ transporter
VLLLAMLPMLGVPVNRWLGPTLHSCLQLVVSTPVVLWCGWPFFDRGWRSIVTWNLNMFTLIAIGTGAAYLYSFAAVIFPGLIPESFRRHGTAEVYFESAAVIVTLVLLGQVLDRRRRYSNPTRVPQLCTCAPLGTTPQRRSFLTVPFRHSFLSRGLKSNKSRKCSAN